MDQELKRYSVRVQAVGITVNLLLSLFKLAAGVLAHSQAMLSDAVHSISDIASDIMVFVGIKMSYKETDQDHPYGHERLESIAAVLLAAVLFLVGAGIGLEGIKTILSGFNRTLEPPGTLALVAAVVSIVTKEWLFRYTRKGAKKIQSDALMANAWHHRSDAFSSIGSFVGILGARLGLPMLDPLACLVICGFIFKAAWDIGKDAVAKLVDRACDPETEAAIREEILAEDGVLGVDLLQTRLFGPKIYVDVEITCKGTLTLEQGHDIAEAVHNRVEGRFPDVKHCMVHVNPAPKQNGPA